MHNERALSQTDHRAERLAAQCWFGFSIVTAICVIVLAALVATIGSGHRQARLALRTPSLPSSNLQTVRPAP